MPRAEMALARVRSHPTRLGPNFLLPRLEKGNVLRRIEVISNACMLRFNAKRRLDCGTPLLDVRVRQNNSFFLNAQARA